MSEEPRRLMSLYVAFLRALYQTHQNNHWLANGNDFYGNHLLFERLYQETQQNADLAAEKTIGLYGDLDIASDIIASIVDRFDSHKYNNNTVASSLKAETAFAELSKLIYDKLKESNELTLGLDDMLMEIHGKHEGHRYLLLRALTTS